MLLHKIFILVSVAGLVYFLLRKRRFDFLTLGYVSAIIYFMPGFAGYTLSPPTPTSPVKLPTPLVPDAYSVMILVISAILIAGIIYDSILAFFPSTPRKTLHLEATHYSPQVAALLAGLGLAATIATVGPVLLSGDKSLVIRALGVWYLVWTCSTTVAAALALCYQRWGILAFAGTMLLADLLLGFRSNAAMTFLLVAVLLFFERGRQRFVVDSWRPAIAALGGGFFFFLWHSVKARLEQGDWSRWFNLLGEPYYYFALVAQSEPFATQHILSEVLRQEFRVGLSHLSDLMSQFMLFAPALGGATTSFNDLFQPRIFPDVEFGVGSNIWAQMWSAGGWELLVAFAVFYSSMLVLGSHLLRARDPAMRAMTAVVFTYWAFYIHRNDIFTQVGLEKRVILIWAISVLGSMILCGAVGRRKRADKPAPPMAGEGVRSFQHHPKSGPRSRY